MDRLKKTCSIKLRVTEEDKLTLINSSKQQSLTLSAYLLHCGLNVNRASSFGSKKKVDNRELIFQLSKIGANLNQLSRWANTYGSGTSLVEMMNHVLAIRTVLERLADKQKA